MKQGMLTEPAMSAKGSIPTLILRQEGHENSSRDLDRLDH